MQETHSATVTVPIKDVIAHQNHITNLDAKLAALLTHVSLMTALCAVFYSQNFGSIFLVETCAYIVITIPILILLLPFSNRTAEIMVATNESKPQLDEISKELTRDYQRAINRSNLYEYCVGATALTTFAFLITLLLKLLLKT